MKNQLQNLYKTRFSGDELINKKNRIWQVLCANWFQRYIPLPPHTCPSSKPLITVVDMAAGYCEFINNIEADYKYAVDLNPDILKYASESITAIVGTPLDMAAKVGIETVDAVFLSNFLEHLDTKELVSEVFAQAKSLLRTGGRLLILQPNIKYTGGKYWDFFDHKLPLTENALLECAEIHGFRTVACVKKFLPYTTKSTLPKAPWIVKLYCKLMPFSGWLFGEQSFLVFEK